jgi:hypothetical protein
MSSTSPIRSTVKPLRTALAAGLIVAAAGVLTQFLVGVPGFPKIPPGPIILGAAAVLVLALTTRRWTLLVGTFAALFVFVGGLIEGSVWGRLGNPGAFDVWIGVVLQWTGLVIALVAGTAAIRQAHTRTAERTDSEGSRAGRTR